MNRFLRGVIQSTQETFPFPEPILEIGSYQVPDQKDIANLRPLFPEKEYLGIDIRPGPGVDYVASVEQLPFADASVGTVLALNTFEHVAHFWLGFEEIFRVLRPDGMVVVSCPFYFHIHNHPCDYWRFTPEALEILLQNYTQRILGWQGNAKKPFHVWAVAFREQYPEITDQHQSKYRELLAQFAHEPLPWLRKIRYQMGRWLCGRRPFIPYLEQEKWGITCQPALFAKSLPGPQDRGKVVMSPTEMSAL